MSDTSIFFLMYSGPFRPLGLTSLTYGHSISMQGECEGDNMHLIVIIASLTLLKIVGFQGGMTHVLPIPFPRVGMVLTHVAEIEHNNILV